MQEQRITVKLVLELNEVYPTREAALADMIDYYADEAKQGHSPWANEGYEQFLVAPNTTDPEMPWAIWVVMAIEEVKG